MSLHGKVALVTGASRGIGKAIAERLGREGASVVINYYANRQGADERARAAEDQLRGLFDLAEKHFGGLDILITNAATWRFASIADATVDDFDVVFRTNARATFIAMHEAAHRLRDAGRVVAISAGLALMPRPGTAIYGASKAAINHLVRVLAHELGPRQITVNAVLPGAVNTDAIREQPVDIDKFIAGEIAQTPLRRIGQPDDIADVVAFLISDDARWVTGQSIAAGGGMF